MSAEATIYDVAELAGVSISTVSLAFNTPARVKPATLDRVMAAVDELGFVPKNEAVTRARRGVGRIGVIAPFTSFPSFARRLNGVLTALRGESFETVVFDQESAATSQLVTLPLTRRVDGLIVMSIPINDDIADRLIHQKIPTVMVELPHSRFTSITIDNQAGGRMVAELLSDQGHQQVAFIGHTQEIEQYVLQSETRLRGFRDGLSTAGLPLEESQIRRIEHSFAAATAAASDLLNADNPPTAIFAHDDLLAAGALAAARKVGRAVPDDVAVVGFDDSELAESLGLTSVSQPLEESGEIATRALLDHLSDRRQAVQHITLGLTLLERSSTRA